MIAIEFCILLWAPTFLGQVAGLPQAHAASGAAGERGDTASARFMLAAGLAIASMPVLLGALADQVGLHLAHLMVPCLVALALICFVVAQAFERSAIAPARCP